MKHADAARKRIFMRLLHIIRRINQMNKVEGKLVANGAKIGIVAARFNEFIVSKLVSGAEDALLRHDVNADDITVAWVPGAFEIGRAHV